MAPLAMLETSATSAARLTKCSLLAPIAGTRSHLSQDGHEPASPVSMVVIDSTFRRFGSSFSGLCTYSNSKLRWSAISSCPGASRPRVRACSNHSFYPRRGVSSASLVRRRKLAVGRTDLKKISDVISKYWNVRWAGLVARAQQQFLKASSEIAKGSTQTRSSLVDELNGSDRGDPVSMDAEPKQSPSGVFPGGVRRAEVLIPGLVLRLQVVEVLEGKAFEGFLDALSAIVAEGLTMVIVESGVDGEGGARLYEAACLLKSVLRGRAELLVAERVDIAAAAGADGVVLSDEGLPTVVARRMMQNAVSDSAVLPLVARTVSSTQSARSATALEGADFLLLQCPDVEDLGSYTRNVCNEVSIPVFVDVSTRLSGSKDETVGPALELFEAGASGLILDGTKLMEGGVVCDYVTALSSCMTTAMNRRRSANETQSGKDYLQVVCNETTDEGSSPGNGRGLEVALDLDELAKLIVEEERELLTTMVEFVRAASPEMEEISLLVDAVKQLDELFLLVIVGEFNSGKSSVINALLGKRFLKEGVLPTTNEITVLRHTGEGYEGEERSEKHPDGHFLRYLPAELLKQQMNLVDTPGTNVILQRQQRLTEEFVPRADLVLFVLSVDRPLTESEVTFLRYIRQWGKKIIFILNKSDVLSDRKELEEVLKFVKENAQRLLSVDEAFVYPVSARRALLAKQAAVKEDGVVDRELLMQDTSWKSSGFEELEDFIFCFLGGSTDAGAERLRLKLETPLGIGMALLGASDRQLAADILKADMDLRVLAQIEEQLNQYENAVQADAALQRQRTSLLITGAKGRADKLVDSILRLSNIEAIIKYLLGADGVQTLPVSSEFGRQVMGSATTDIQRVLEEHGSWMVSNALRQLDIYGELVKSRWPEVIPDLKAGTSNGLQLNDKFKEEQQKNSSNSIAVLEAFDVKAAEILLDQEIREVVLSTFSGVGAAGVTASVLTSVLPTTLEDLLALGICTAGGFVGIWNLPAKRQDIKNKISRVADNLTKQLQHSMERDLEQNLDQLRADIQGLTAPYRLAAEAERARVLALQSQLQGLDNQLRFLKQKVQNLGT
ncbi:hypothetical protein Mapa_016410 [Marchantia paleacea]|nr:hypothetical protein Mapa_016410 [Marchantia paleacea]